MPMPDFHSHKCDDQACGTRWDHERLVGSTKEAYEDAHRCPTCGKVQYYKFFGPGSVQTEKEAAQLGAAAMLDSLEELITSLMGERS
jgi:hypothetical protein